MTCESSIPLLSDSAALDTSLQSDDDEPLLDLALAIGSTRAQSQNVNAETPQVSERDLPESVSEQRSRSVSPCFPSSHGSRRSRRHRHHRRRSRFRFKKKESNFIAAVCSMFVLVLLCTALAEPQWFYITGGGCHALDRHHTPVYYLGVSQFFYIGEFFTSISTTGTQYKYGPGENQVFVDCVTAQIVSIMKSIIALNLFGILFSLIAFLLDLSGPTFRMLKVVRRHGVFNIMTVLVCVVINGFSYWLTDALQHFQSRTKQHEGSKAVIQFSISFYLVTAAGAMSVFAAACNLLRKHPNHECHHSDGHHSDTRTDQERLLGGVDGLDVPCGQDHIASPMSFMPPPPYSP